MNINKIKFTSGTIYKMSDEFYNLTLKNGNKIVYQATIYKIYAAELIDKYDNKKIKLI